MVSSSEQQVVIDFSLGGFYLTRVSTPNGTQQIVSVPKMASMLEAGAPDLPQFPVPAIIGDMAEMQVNVTMSDFTDYENVEIAPSKGNFSRQIDPESVPYTYGEMYSKDAFYPAAQAYLETPYIIRDFRGQNIMVHPFAYNPMTKTLRVYHAMTIEMSKVSDNGINQKSARKAQAKMSPETKAAYDHRFINSKEGTSKYTFQEDRGEMLVICPDQYLEAMQPFVTWKNQSGRPTTMVSVTEAGGNNDTQIKNYILNIYNNPERNLEFVLLVGDYADITPHAMNGGRSDNWFGQLEGNDFYIEVLTGRFSVGSVEDVNTHVNKVLYYERDITAEAEWCATGIGVGKNEGAGSGHFGEADYVHIDFIRDTLLHYTYVNVHRDYEGVSGVNSSAAILSQHINQGSTVINYCNHGSETSWGVFNYSNSHVNALTNDNMLPYVWSVACLNGKFGHSVPCFAEAWMRATNNSTGAPTGAIGGMFSWIEQPWQPPMYGQDEMVNILTGWKSADKFNHTLGGASLNGNMYVLDAAPGDNGNTHNTWILFGDPSLMVRTDNPASMNISCDPAILMLGMSELEITAENTTFGIATLMMDGEVIASGNINNGTCTLSFAPMSDIGTATLTVIGYNKVTEVISVEVLPAEGPFVTVANYTPNFAPVNEPTSLTISFKNIGVDPTNGNTAVTLTCADERMNILNGTANFGVLNAEETTTLQDAFSFIIAEGVEDNTRFQINVEMTDGRQTWNGKLYITAGRAILNYVGTDWAGSFVPGETLTIVAKFKNVGHYMATNAIANIACENQYVTLHNTTLEMGTIDPEGISTCVFTLQIDESCPETEVIPVQLSMQADGNLNTEGTLTLKNTCVVIVEMNDSYGDGWNGNKLKLSFSDGTPDMELTLGAGQSSGTETLEIGIGVHVTLTWITGQYTYECSFVMKYEDGDVIYSGSNPSAGVLHEFDCNCTGGTPISNYAPVENLDAEIEIGIVILTWNAPENATSYTIFRNGIQIGETEETTYTNEVTSEIYFTYCVVANYSPGSSAPECIVVKSELSVDEIQYEFTVYPNPANSTLYISGVDAEYSYVMYNGMGQVVANGKAQGAESVNVSSMAKGIYFLRLTTGTQVLVEKVVVK